MPHDKYEITSNNPRIRFDRLNDFDTGTLAFSYDSRFSKTVRLVASSIPIKIIEKDTGKEAEMSFNIIVKKNPSEIDVKLNSNPVDIETRYHCPEPCQVYKFDYAKKKMIEDGSSTVSGNVIIDTIYPKSATHDKKWGNVQASDKDPNFVRVTAELGPKGIAVKSFSSAKFLKIKDISDRCNP